ncbi:MAG: HDOD domain-containing protein, partial [Planctomycetes bacterium]|nr:HDOD domain-containing protein [Planctomycetota bacterium]
LLHDVGKIVLGTYVEVDAEPIFEVAFAGSKTFDEAEQEVLGIDHAEVGARLLESWGLPSAMVEAVRFHHRPQALEGDKTLVALVHLADSLVMMSGVALGREGLSYRIQEDIVEALGVKTKDAEKALALAMIRLQEAIESEGGQG